jgi:hypothetical protein
MGVFGGDSDFIWQPCGHLNLRVFRLVHCFPFFSEIQGKVL